MRKSFNALEKARRQEAAARNARRHAEAAMKSEYADAVAKYFPVLSEWDEADDGTVVPKVPDIDAFVAHLAELYAADEAGSKAGESSTAKKAPEKAPEEPPAEVSEEPSEVAPEPEDDVDKDEESVPHLFGD